MTDLIERLEGLSAADARIIARLDRGGDCWLWTGPLDERGRGRVWHNGKIKIHHRAVWEILVGEIPKGALLCHHCDNPTCANPAHLYVGDAKSNVADMMSRGRHWTTLDPQRAKEVARKNGSANTWCKGVNNPRAKLTEAEIETVRATSGNTFALARKLGVHPTTIQRVRRAANA